MTEQEWLPCTDPQPMLDFLEGKGSERKLRLFAVACCRRIWHLLTDERSRTAVEVAEKYAEHLVSEEDRAIIHDVLHSDTDYNPERDASGVAFACATQSVQANAMWAAQSTVMYAKLARSATLGFLQAADAEAEEGKRQARFLHCIFGNPFPPITLNPAWLTPTVKALASTIYETRAFDQMPVLGDALEEAGCTVAEVLEHCRSGGEHVRGCWVVDKVLGRG
jgi:hypothetical protein